MIEANNIVTKFGDRVIHDGVNIRINRGEIYGILGESGSGKSVLMKQMIMLLSPTSGSMKVLGYDLNSINYKDAQKLRQQWGVLFQFGAMFSSLSVTDNIKLQLKEYTDISSFICDEIVKTKISMAGLPAEVGSLYPSELSGGMIKRASLARALVMNPKLLFLDEPTSGLDPIGARNFDKLILELRDIFGITVVVITHDLDSISSIIDRFCVLADKRVVAEGSLDEVLGSTHPFVEKFFKNDYAKRHFKKKRYKDEEECIVK